MMLAIITSFSGLISEQLSIIWKSNFAEQLLADDLCLK